MHGVVAQISIPHAGQACLRLPMFSQVYALKMEILALLAAANRCPPVLKQHSAHALIAISFTSLRPQEACLHGHGRLTRT